jgi:hypothetical protein
MSILKILLLIVLFLICFHRILAMTWLLLIYALFTPFLLFGLLLAGVIEAGAKIKDICSMNKCVVVNL